MAWVLGTLMLCTVRCLSVTSQWAQYLWFPIYVASANLRLCSTVFAQLLSHVWLFETPWTAACQASLSFTISWSLLKLMSVESVMPSNHLVLCHPLLILPSVFPNIRFFSNESALRRRVAKVLELQLQYQSFQWAFKVYFLYDWLVWSYKTKRLSFQHHSLKASILWYSIFFTVQLSHSYITSQKTIDLTIWIFVDKVISLLFNRLHRFVIIFLPRN